MPTQGSHYRGWRSTKLHCVLIAMGAATLAYGLAGAPEGAFPAYCTALVALAGLYSGAAAVEKFAPPPAGPTP